MAGPDWSKAVVPARKLTHYLLALDHPEGGSKAAFLGTRGFGPDRPDVLADALRIHAASGAAVSASNDFGVKYVVDGPLRTPGGGSAPFRSVWIVEFGEDVPRFVTAYPLELRRGDL